MPARFRGALLASPLLLLLACGGGSSSSSVNPTANDPTSNASAVSADFDPSTGNIPLPNVLLTAAATATLTPTAGTPFTPDKALVWLNQQEAGGTHAVSGVNAPIYMSFSGAVDPATVNASTVKVFQVLPDTPTNPSSTENGTLGFRDVSAQFTYQMLPSGKEVYLMPQVPMLAGARYLYVATSGVHDPSGKSIGSSLVFGIEKYVKGGASVTSYAQDTTNLADLSDTTNPAAVLGQATATQLESIAGNVGTSPTLAFSGYRKVMWDLIANGSTDVSGQTAYGAGPTGITSRDQIAVLGRMVMTGTGFTKPDPVGNPSVLAPLETLMWGWANNANLSSGIPGANFSTAASRTWNNGVSNFQVIASSAVPSGNPGSLADIFTAAGAPSTGVGMIAWGSFESADIQVDPAVVQANMAAAGGNETGVTGIYNPGTSTVPGSNTLMAFRDSGGVLRGWYHQTRTVPFVLFVPTTGSATTWPVLIFEHGIGRSKEDAIGLASTACRAGYAVIAIDQAVHGFGPGTGSFTPPAVTTGMGNGRPQAEWASNFFMLPSTLTARANIYDSAFDLWRLERILNQPTADPTSLTAQLSAATAVPTSFPFSGGVASLNTGPTTHRFVGQSLGSIVGTVFLAGNAAATGGSGMKGFLSVPGARLAFILHDSPAFKSAVDSGLASAGVPTGSPSYNKFFVLAQSVADSVDPATMMGPLPTGGASRLAGRIAAQEAVGDLVIPNSNGNYWANALGGRIPQFGADTSGGFTQVLKDGDTSPALPFMFGNSYSTFKAAVAADNPAGSVVGPTQGVFQFGTLAASATHGLLLDGSANTAAAQRQMAIWLATGKIADGANASNGYPIARPTLPPQAELFGPESLRIFFPKAE